MIHRVFPKETSFVTHVRNHIELAEINLPHQDVGVKPSVAIVSEICYWSFVLELLTLDLLPVTEGS